MCKGSQGLPAEALGKGKKGKDCIICGAWEYMREECAQPLLCQSLTPKAGAGVRAGAVAAVREGMPLIGTQG